MIPQVTEHALVRFAQRVLGIEIPNGMSNTRAIRRIRRFVKNNNLDRLRARIADAAALEVEPRPDTEVWIEQPEAIYVVKNGMVVTVLRLGTPRGNNGYYRRLKEQGLRNKDIEP